MMKLLSKVLLITLLLFGLFACAGHDKETQQMILRERIGNAYGVHYLSLIHI